MSTPATLPDGPWQCLLRYGHRLSKDIDIFGPDSQSLGYVNPRLSDVAAEITADYVLSHRIAAVHTLGYTPSYRACVTLATEFLHALLEELTR